ncbi:hypothetical protein N431DRAFT_198409 [Stipitochalara longipes BDJ]|nr:hypothetical protein N431DRAFT_198409 [Stipitochalara longipes BDJ]
MIDDMGRGSIATGTAEPLAATKAFDNTARGMNAAVSSPNVSLTPEESLKANHLRAGVGGKFLLIINSSQTQGLHTVHRDACQTLSIIVVEDFSLIVIIIISPPARSQAAASSILPVEQTLVRVYVRKIIGTSVDRSSRIGDEVVSEVGKCPFHCSGLARLLGLK